MRSSHGPSIRCKTPSWFHWAGTLLSPIPVLPSIVPSPSCLCCSPLPYTCPTFTPLTQLRSFTLLPSCFRSLSLSFSFSHWRPAFCFNIETYIQYMHVCTLQKNNKTFFFCCCFFSNMTAPFCDLYPHHCTGQYRTAQDSTLQYIEGPPCPFL